MKITQYNQLNKKAKAYFNSLDLKEVSKEFCNSPLLNQNKKLLKGELENFGLELTPSKFGQNKFNQCGNEGKCLFTCLVFSGIANLMTNKNNKLSPVLKKRLRRTFLLQNDKSFFMQKLTLEINMLRSLYADNLAIRLNVFSDLDWDNMINLKQFKGVQFYDYTKRSEYLDNSKRHLTYSVSEKTTTSEIRELLKNGYNVAIVFHVKKLPLEYLGYEVIDGDIDDNRYKDKKGVIVGLSQKTTIGGKVKTAFTR